MYVIEYVILIIVFIVVNNVEDIIMIRMRMIICDKLFFVRIFFFLNESLSVR